VIGALADGLFEAGTRCVEKPEIFPGRCGRDRVKTWFQHFALEAGMVAVDEEKWLGTRKNNPEIYGQLGSGEVGFPFRVEVDPVDRLLLAYFRGDPTYSGAELRVYRDSRGEEGAAVFLHKRDGTLEGYHTPGFYMAEKQQGFQRFFPRMKCHETDFSWRFLCDGSSLDAQFQLVDSSGTRIELQMTETTTPPDLKPLFLPFHAPAPAPSCFPILFLDKCRVLPVESGHLRILINGKERKGWELPLSKDRVYMGCYARKPALFSWNDESEGSLPFVGLTGLEGLGRGEETAALTYDLIGEEDHREIKGFLARRESHTLRFRFSPAIPDITCLREYAKVRGRFSVSLNEWPGLLAGEWDVQRTGKEIFLSFVPLHAWQPASGLKWVKTYRWLATVQPIERGIHLVETPRDRPEFLLSSRWERQ